jgi:hypothetical protein
MLCYISTNWRNQCEYRIKRWIWFGWWEEAVCTYIFTIGVSEWLLFNANSAIFQLYHGENKLIINEMMMRSTLYYTNMLSWIFIVLANWNNSSRIDMSLHSLFWFWANQSSLFLSGDASNNNLIIFSLTRSGLEPTIYRTSGDHANHYTTDVVYRITGNFCGVKFQRFWTKKKTFNFCRFFFLRIENLGTEKKWFVLQEAMLR